MKNKLSPHDVLDTLMILNKEKVREVYTNWKYGNDCDYTNIVFRPCFQFIFNNLSKYYLDSIIEE